MDVFLPPPSPPTPLSDKFPPPITVAPTAVATAVCPPSELMPSVVAMAVAAAADMVLLAEVNLTTTARMSSAVTLSREVENRISGIIFKHARRGTNLGWLETPPEEGGRKDK